MYRDITNTVEVAGRTVSLDLLAGLDPRFRLT